MDLQEVFELHAAGRTRVMYEKRELESVNEDFQAIQQGEVGARLVFDFGVGEPTVSSEKVLTGEAKEPSTQSTGEAANPDTPMPG